MHCLETCQSMFDHSESISSAFVISKIRICYSSPFGGFHDFMKLNNTTVPPKRRDRNDLEGYIFYCAWFKAAVANFTQVCTLWRSGRKKLDVGFHLRNTLETDIQCFLIPPVHKTMDTFVKNMQRRDFSTFHSALPPCILSPLAQVCGGRRIPGP